VAVAIALREPIEDGLLNGNDTLYWIGIGAIAAYGASYFARGFLAGSHRATLYALLIISESVSRTAFPLAVAIGIASGQSVVAMGIVAAPTVSLIVVPFAFLRRGVPEAREETAAAATPESAGEAPPDEFSFAHGGGFAAAVLLIMLSEQTFLNAGPLLVKGTAGVAAAGFIFNILMIARAPLQLFQAVTTALLPHLTRLRSEGNETDFRASVRVTIMGIAAFAGVVALAMLAAGPELMQIAFGDKFTYERPDLLIVTVGMGLYLSAATLNQAALAQGQVRRAAVCWVACAAVFVVWTLVPLVEDEFRRVEVGYLASAALLCAVLYFIYRRPHGRPDDAIEPGSSEELEIQLASGDEAG
jgi:O-antigen/teichoic acid export membrane protein